MRSLPVSRCSTRVFRRSSRPDRDFAHREHRVVRIRHCPCQLDFIKLNCVRPYIRVAETVGAVMVRSGGSIRQIGALSDPNSLRNGRLSTRPVLPMTRGLMHRGPTIPELASSLACG